MKFAMVLITDPSLFASLSVLGYLPFQTLLKPMFSDLRELNLCIWLKRVLISWPSIPVADISRTFRDDKFLIEFDKGSMHSFENLMCEIFKLDSFLSCTDCFSNLKKIYSSWKFLQLIIGFLKWNFFRYLAFLLDRN